MKIQRRVERERNILLGGQSNTKETAGKHHMYYVHNTTHCIVHLLLQYIECRVLSLSYISICPSLTYPTSISGT